jgi:hypothetical protein
MRYVCDSDASVRQSGGNALAPQCLLSLHERASMSGTFIAIAIWLGIIVLVSLAVAVAVRKDGEPRHHDGN